MEARASLRDLRVARVPDGSRVDRASEAPRVEGRLQIVFELARVVGAEAFEEAGGHERVRALDRERDFCDDPALNLSEERAEHLRAADDVEVALQIVLQGEH